MQREFKRVVIVNRGEAAMRFIHAAREFNRENGTSICTIALYTEPDRNAMFVREADEAVFLGPARIIDPSTNQSKSTYVDFASLKTAMTSARADAVWVGWGFVAEHPDFADLCREMGVVFIGPDGEAMRRLGDKITAKRLAELAQVPVAPWSGGPVETIEDALRHAERLGYPLLIKATSGGGGHGIRRVHSANQLARALEGARAEAFKAFGDATVFMEQLVQGARHVDAEPVGMNLFFLASVPESLEGNYRMLAVDDGGAVFDLDPEHPVNRYQAASDISQAGARELRTAGNVYPPDVAASNLGLHRSCARPRLAQRITASADNNYDKAIALETYLCTHYGLQPEAAAHRAAHDPSANSSSNANRDAAILCLLDGGDAANARIPSRWSIDFGPASSRSHFAIVTASNAHSWVEAYFPGCGRVAFDPHLPGS